MRRFKASTWLFLTYVKKVIKYKYYVIMKKYKCSNHFITNHTLRLMIKLYKNVGSVLSISVHIFIQRLVHFYLYKN